MLEEQGGEPTIPLMEAWNKWDLLAPDQAAELMEQSQAKGETVVVPVSALTGLGCDGLLEAVSKLLTQKAKMHSFVLPVGDGQRLAWLHAHGEVVSEDDAGSDERGPLRRLEVRLDPRELGRFARL